MNDEYSDAFKAIVPEAPSSASWADGARRKRRNRGRAMAGVAAAAAIAMIVPVALTMGTNSALIANPAATSEASPDPGINGFGAAACLEGSAEPQQGTDEGATAGAVRAWLCGDTVDPEQSPGIVGPSEPLLEGAEQIVTFIQSQPELMDRACTEEYRLTYRVILDYEDGSQRVVPGELHGCRTITDGPTVRGGGQELYDLALDLWRTQRERLDGTVNGSIAQFCPPPSRPSEAGPPAMRFMLPLDPAKAVGGDLCVEYANVGRDAGLEPALVSMISDGVATQSSEGSVPGGLRNWLTLTGEWGETVTLQRTPDDIFRWFDGDTSMLWKPPGDILSQLDAAAKLPPDSTPSPSEPGIEPTRVIPDMPPKRFASEGCADANSGKNISSKLPDGTLPDGPSKIWFCSGQGQGQDGVGPLEPLVSPSLVAEAVASYNTSSETEYNRACLEVAGPDYIIVHDYPDGTRYAITMQIEGCDGLSDGQTVREGGRVYADELVRLWQDQRLTTPPSQTRPGPLCPQLVSLFPINPVTTSFVSGNACVDWDISSEGVLGQAVEVSLSPELVASLPAQLATAVPDLPEGRPEYGGLVLLTAEGDPFSLLQGRDGSFYWRDGESLRFWTPTGVVAEELKKIFES